jgi:hypothetical protein
MGTSWFGMGPAYGGQVAPPQYAVEIPGMAIASDSTE